MVMSEKKKITHSAPKALKGMVDFSEWEVCREYGRMGVCRFGITYHKWNFSQTLLGHPCFLQVLVPKADVTYLVLLLRLLPANSLSLPPQFLIFLLSYSTKQKMAQFRKCFSSNMALEALNGFGVVEESLNSSAAYKV